MFLSELRWVQSVQNKIKSCICNSSYMLSLYLSKSLIVILKRAVPDVKDPMTPPSSFTGSPDRCYELGSEPDSPYSGPDSCPDSPLDDDMEMSAPPSPVRTNAGLSAGLLDRTRLVLCVFMFSILAFNPFGFLINKGFESFMVGSGTGFSGDSDTMSAGGRKLMGGKIIYPSLIDISVIWNMYI